MSATAAPRLTTEERERWTCRFPGAFDVYNVGKHDLTLCELAEPAQRDPPRAAVYKYRYKWERFTTWDEAKNEFVAHFTRSQVVIETTPQTGILQLTSGAEERVEEAPPFVIPGAGSYTIDGGDFVPVSRPATYTGLEAQPRTPATAAAIPVRSPQDFMRHVLGVHAWEPTDAVPTGARILCNGRICRFLREHARDEDELGWLVKWLLAHFVFGGPDTDPGSAVRRGGVFRHVIGGTPDAPIFRDIVDEGDEGRLRGVVMLEADSTRDLFNSVSSALVRADHAAARLRAATGGGHGL